MYSKQTKLNEEKGMDDRHLNSTNLNLNHNLHKMLVIFIEAKAMKTDLFLNDCDKVQI